MYRNCFRHSEQFLYTTCSPHVLQKEELLTKIYLYRDANNACAQMNGQDFLGARLTVLPSTLCPYLNKQKPITIDLTGEENNNEGPEKSPPIKQ